MSVWKIFSFCIIYTETDLWDLVLVIFFKLMTPLWDVWLPSRLRDQNGPQWSRGDQAGSRAGATGNTLPPLCHTPSRSVPFRIESFNDFSYIYVCYHVDWCAKNKCIIQIPMHGLFLTFTESLFFIKHKTTHVIGVCVVHIQV